MSNSTLTKTLAGTLNQLLTRAHDAEHGYLVAAEATLNPALRDFFEENSHQRWRFRQVWRQHLDELSIKPEPGRSLASKAHKPFMKIKTALSNENDIALIEECRRGERTAILDYKTALETPDLPESIAATIRRQGKHIMNQLDALNSIEQALRKTVR
ncbi:PA2169 family four-helix-bundle protein [Haloferula rosea]|uniref:PA2169 family four-helix-bundle protein n=1 Tax=Haloferula rosea TaxID=490093 RepID=A0A934RAZ5_9BACT|nr:PA2169 family four-helix-bundle protein [Haloferula rosea]MBK1825656.1 PA2169 family four-helix-bundle protein [Haloferula rosea]